MLEPMVPLRVELFTRRGCHLCDDAKAELQQLAHGLTFQLVETDVDQDFALQQAYGSLVPVVTVNGQRASVLRLNIGAVRAALEGAR